MGTHTSSVHPGNTVDSNIIKSPFSKYLPINLHAFFSGSKSGCLNSSIGVGTVII